MTDDPRGESDLIEQLETLEGLQEWALSDREITHPRQDLFKHDSIANRIALRLNNCSTEVMPTMAVVGERGSGKSSIGRLVEHYLHSNPRMLFVKLSLWPFDSTNAAVRGILSELIRELGTRVNTLSIAVLPEQYAAAAEKLGPWASVLALFRRLPNPKEIIEQLDQIALATDLRIVFWIEDLERFSGTVTMNAEGAELREEERLGPIRSLLWLLNECLGISVVVADASLHSRFDVDKIARFVERVPPLDLDQAGKLIGLLRNECLNGYPTTVIDPVAPEERKKFDLSEPLSRSFRDHLWSAPEPEPFEALIQLARTPRGLKSVLRSSLEIWELMPGEIDLDHVIAASAIRSTYPEVFEFLDANVQRFRRGFRTGGSNEQVPTKNETYLAFDKLLHQPPSIEAANAIRSLICFVFSAFPRDRIIADIYRQYLTRPQGLNISEPVDYWNRFMRCATISNEISDQHVLGQIRAWKDGRNKELVSMLTDQSSHRHVEAFVSQFDFRDLLDLLSEVVNLERQDDSLDWSSMDSPLGGVNVWRMLNRIPQYGSALVTTRLQELLQDLVPSHLPYANFLFGHFCVPVGRDLPPHTDESGTIQLGELVQSRLLESFPPEKANDLLSALRDPHPYLLQNFLRDIKRGCHSENDLPMDGWKRFAETLLELAELAPRVGIPIVLSFVMSTSDRVITSKVDEAGKLIGPTRVTEFQFQEAASKELFDWDRLRAMVGKEPIPNDLDQWIREMWKAAKDAVCG